MSVIRRIALTLGCLLIALSGACGNDDRPADSRGAAERDASRATRTAADTPEPTAEPSSEPTRSLGACRITGQVRISGAPCSAEITLRARLSKPTVDPRRTWLERAVGGSTPLTPFASVKSADGAFAFDAVAVGGIRVFARALPAAKTRSSPHAGFADVILEVDGESRHVLIELQPVAPRLVLRGRVVGLPADAPAAFASALEPEDEDTSSEQLSDRPRVQLSKDGTFELSVPDVPRVSVLIEVPGRLSLVSLPIPLPTDDVVTIDVNPSKRSLTVRVLDDLTGQPISGAIVGASTSNPWLTCVGATDDQGVCVLPRGTDRVDLSVRADGYPGSASLELAPDRDHAEVALRAGASVRVRVVRATDGRPVAGVPVFVVDFGPSGAWGGDDPLISDEQGAVVFPARRPGEVLVFAMGAGWFSQGLEMGELRGETNVVNDRHPRMRSYAVPTQGELDVELKVSAGVSVRGRVVDHAGAGVARAIVSTHPVSMLPHLGEAAFPVPATTTDEHGHFTLEGLFASAEYGLTAASPLHPGVATARCDPRSSNDMTLTFAEGRWLDVSVVDTHGAPLGVVTVTCEGWRGEDAQFYGYPEATATTDAQGRARLGPVEAGEYVIVAKPKGFIEQKPTRVDVSLESETPPVTLTFTRGEVLRGLAVLPEGGPPEFGSADVQDEDAGQHWGPRFVSSGDEQLAFPMARDGSFEITGLIPGTHKVRVVARNGEQRYEATLRVATGGSRFDVPLREVAATADDFMDQFDEEEFSVKVLGPNGRPVGQAQVAATWSHGGGGHSSTTFSVEAGTVRLPLGVRGTVVTITNASTSNGIRLDAGTLQVRIPAEAADGHVVQLPASEVVSGRVIDDSGNPFPGLRVSVHPPRDADDPFKSELAAAGSALTAEDGSFAVTGLGPGQYELSVNGPGDCVPLSPLAVRGGQTGIALTLVRSERPAVLVVDANNDPVIGATVTFRERDDHFGERGLTVMTDDSGRALLRVPPEGLSFWLSVEAKSRSLNAANVAWDGSAEMTVVLTPRVNIAGSVRFADGELARKVDVWWREAPTDENDSAEADSGGWWRSAVTDREGRFQIELEEAVSIDVFAGNVASSGSGFRGSFVSPSDTDFLVKHARRVAAGTAKLDLTIPKRLMVTVRLAGLTDDRPLAELPALTDSKDRHTLVATRTTDPRTLIYSGVDPDRTYSLCVRIPRLQLAGRATAIRAGTVPSISLVRGVDLTGNIARAADDPAGNAIEVRFSIAGLDVYVTAEDDGSFVIPCLPPEEGRLSAWSYGNDLDSWSVDGPATPGAAVTLRLKHQR